MRIARQPSAGFARRVASCTAASCRAMSRCRNGDHVAAAASSTAIDRLLGVDAREAVGEHELAARCANSPIDSARFHRMGCIAAGVQCAGRSSRRRGRSRRRVKRGTGPAGARAAAPSQNRRLDVGLRAHLHLAGHAVDDDRIALFDDLVMLGTSLTAGSPGRADDGDMLDAPASSSTTPRSRARS